MYARVTHFVLWTTLFLSSAALADLCGISGVSFQSITTESKRQPLADVLKSLESTPCFNETTGELLISDPVTDLSLKQTATHSWVLSRYDARNQGFAISLPTGQHEFVLPPQTVKSKVYHCPGNMMNSGTNIYPLDNKKLRLIEAWSCAQAGCSYSYFYSESADNSLELLCNSF